ncbi:MAG: hypothetical protein WDN66_02580 [Candidatus Saccharibacteria bacterium]
MHHIKVFILLQLSESPSKRYSELKPKAMEPAQFMYHLKQLIEDGLVIKEGESYRLSSAGVQYIDKLNNDNLTPHKYPRLTMSMIYMSPKKGALLYRQDRRPGLGLIGFLLQDIPMDFPSPLEVFAKKTFKERTGVDADFKHKADGYIRVNTDGKLLANMLTHVMVANGPDFYIDNDDFIWEKDITNDAMFESAIFVLDQLSKNEDLFFFENGSDV